VGLRGSGAGGGFEGPRRRKRLRGRFGCLEVFTLEIFLGGVGLFVWFCFLEFPALTMGFGEGDAGGMGEGEG
jgi:hypothetical protein